MCPVGAWFPVGVPVMRWIPPVQPTWSPGATQHTGAQGPYTILDPRGHTAPRNPGVPRNTPEPRGPTHHPGPQRKHTTLEPRGHTAHWTPGATHTTLDLRSPTPS